MTETIDTAPIAEALAPPSAVAPPPADNGSVTTSTEPFDLDANLAKILRRDNPYRDDGGRFRGDQPAQAEAEAAPEVPPDSNPPAEQKQAVAPAIPPPQSLSAEEKAEWASLPPKAQEIISRRDREATQALSRQGNEIKAYEPIRRAVEQNREFFESEGVAPDDGFNRFIVAAKALKNDPAAAIAQIAQAYGVDLRQFSQGQQPSGNPSPEAMQLHQKIARLERQLNDTSTRIASREQAEANTQQQSMQSLIDKFSSDKADWADLETDVEAEIKTLNYMIEQGRADPMTPEQKLAKAYDRAIRNNDHAWAKKQEAERKAEETKKIEEAKRRLADAEKAKKINMSSSPSKGATVQDVDAMLLGILRRDNPKG